MHYYSWGTGNRLNQNTTHLYPVNELAPPYNSSMLAILCQFDNQQEMQINNKQIIFFNTNLITNEGIIISYLYKNPTICVCLSESNLQRDKELDHEFAMG